MMLVGGCPRSGPDWRPLLLRSRGRALVPAYGESARPDPTVLRSGEDYLELSLERVVLRPPPGWSGKAVAAALEVTGLRPDGRAVRTLAALSRAGTTAPLGESSRIGAVPYRGTNITITLHLRDLDPPESAHVLGRLEATRHLIRRLDPADEAALNAGAAHFAAALGSGSRRRMWTYSFSLLAPGAATGEEDLPASATHYVLVLSPGTGRGVLPAPAPLAWRSSSGPGLEWPNGRPFQDASYLVLRIQRRRRLGLPTRAGGLLAEAQSLLTQGVLGPVAGRLHQVVAAIGTSARLSEREKSLQRSSVELLRIRLAAAKARDRNDTGLRIRKLAAEIAGLAQHRAGFADLLLPEEVAQLHRRVATIARWARAARSEHRVRVDDIQVALREYRRGLPPGPRDEIPQAAPVLGGTEPPSPTSVSLRPVVRGQAAAGARISFFADPDCRGGVAGTATAAADGSFSLSLPAARDSVTRLTAQVRGPKGELSACSSPLVFVHDATPPEAPKLSGTEPRSPSRTQVAARVVGRAEPGASLRLFRDSTCRDKPLAIAPVDRQGAFRVPVAVAPNSRSLFWVAAVDAAGNASSCTGPAVYEHDDKPPAAPVLLATEPASPSAATAAPTLVGRAEAGATVRLFGAAECSGPEVAHALASREGVFRVKVGARAQATTTFSAMTIDTAGNRSACGAALAFVHDAIGPEPPRLTGALPASPGRTTTRPEIIGVAEPGATVRLFTASPCAGEPAGVGQVTRAGTFQVAVSIAPNAPTSVYASATDAAGNISKCGIPLAYIHDDRAPPAPRLVALSPRSPSRLTSRPTVQGIAESGALVQLYADAGCVGTPVAKGKADEKGRFGIQVLLQENRRTRLWATASDAAGNRSTCAGSLRFEHDAVAPSPPVLLGTRPKSPSHRRHPTVLGKAEPGSTVALYTSVTCSGKPVGRGRTSRSGKFRVRVRVRVEMDALTTFSATASDRAGNVSGCSPDMLRYRQQEPNDPP